MDQSRTRKVETSVWRLGPNSVLMFSVAAHLAPAMAELEPDAIFFYAELEGSAELTHTHETMDKVYKALANVGLSEGQILGAVSGMMNSGILFRERAF